MGTRVAGDEAPEIPAGRARRRLEFQELQQGRQHVRMVHEAGGPCARLFAARQANQQRGVGNLAAEEARALAPVALLAQQGSVVGEKDHHRIVEQAQFFGRCEHLAEPVVHLGR